MLIVTLDTDLLADPFYVNTPRNGGVLRYREFSRTITEEASIGSTIRLCRMPQGSILVSHLSVLRVTPATASLTVSLGWEAYDVPGGDPVVAAAEGLGTTFTVADGLYAPFSNFPAAPGSSAFAGEAVLTLLTAGAALDVGTVVLGKIVYAANF